MKSKVFPVLALACLPGLGAAAELEPMAWLTRANEAARHANFTGTMALFDGREERIVRIQQGFDGKSVHQRLVPLSGRACEILRQANESAVVYPHRRLVVYGYKRPGSLMPNLPAAPDQVEKYYVVEVRGRAKVAQRDCQLVMITARDAYRYGCELCVDVDSGLPLRVRMFTASGERIERFSFTSLQLLKSMRNFARESFHLQTDTHGYETVDMPYGARPAPRKWQVKNMPPGFRERLFVVRRLPRNPEPVYHMVVADPLSRISVFITRLPEGDKARRLRFVRPAHHAYITVRDGYRVTVIGGVPMRTIRMIGDSLQPLP